MKFLFDENLAANLAREFVGVHVGTTHVTALGLEGAGDRAIWDRAAADDFVLVTKDEDFHRLSLLLGPPPKVVWIRLGNCSTADVANLLRTHRSDVLSFTEQTENAFLERG